MNIQIDGTGLQNKGAELMLYAILEQIQSRYPSATVYYNSLSGDISRIKTNLNFKHRTSLKFGRFPSAIFRRIGVLNSIFDCYHPYEKIDYVLDGSGFKYGDQWKYSADFYYSIELYYRRLKEYDSKIIFLPQAFGPFETSESRKIVDIINKYVDMVFAREIVSYNYLIEAGVNHTKVHLCTDFSIAVKGVIMSEFCIKNGVCVIPNMQMIKHSSISRTQYLTFLGKIVKKCQDLGYFPFFLNHEGGGDLEICRQINSSLASPIEVFSDLDAKQTKGIISQSYAVVSSRYHGVASAINQSIPCLATSWSHKYRELFNDFGLDEDFVLKIDCSDEELFTKLNTVLNFESNKSISQILKIRKDENLKNVNEMWNSAFC